MKWIVFAILLFTNNVQETVYAQKLMFDSKEECQQALLENPQGFVVSLQDYLDWNYGMDHGITVTNIDCVEDDYLNTTSA